MKTETAIILIEDSISDADLIKRVLNRNKFFRKVTHLCDGQEALDYFEAQLANKTSYENTPCIIFLDLKMPRVNGIEVLQKIKSDDRTKAIPVIILTSSTEDPDIKKCYELGANSYVVKPVVYEEFVRAVSLLDQYWFLMNQPTK